MKSTIARLLATVLGGFLLSGCCTFHHSKTWEYKVVELGTANAAASGEQAGTLLNEQAKQGWTFIQSDGGRFYFKRGIR